jgi:antirestriction protein ArdC
MAFDPYQAITDNIIEALEGDVGDVVMPWHRGGGTPINALTNNHYRGINIVNLWVTAQVKNFGSNTWASYKQWQEKGAQVRKGEKSSFIIFYKEYQYEDGDEEKTGRLARASWVFNSDQVDGFEENRPSHGPMQRLEEVDAYLTSTGANIVSGGSSACYRPPTDTIHMPDEDRFFEPDSRTRTMSYYGTVLHEICHWSGAKHRLNRDMTGRFGTESYAMEELVAELGAAFQCGDLGMEPEPRLDHACYIANWIQVLKNDKKAIFTASAKAQEAVE